MTRHASAGPRAALTNPWRPLGVFEIGLAFDFALGPVAARMSTSRPGSCQALSCRCQKAMSYRARFPAIAPV
jgi:hypothetical protein